MYNYIVLFEPRIGRGTKIAFRTNDLKEAQAFCSIGVESLDSLYKDGTLTIYKARETYQN